MNLYILSGLPASGKTTYLSKWTIPEYNIIAHRDDVRQALRNLLGTNEYFPCSSEEEFRFYINFITAAMQVNSAEEWRRDVWIDQTSLTSSSIAKLLNAIDPIYNLNHFDNIIIKMLHTPYKTCLRRNASRTGHERVPDDVMYSMNESFTKYAPNKEEILKRIPEERRQAIGLRLSIEHITTEG